MTARYRSPGRHARAGVRSTRRGVPSAHASGPHRHPRRHPRRRAHLARPQDPAEARRGVRWSAGRPQHHTTPPGRRTVQAHADRVGVVERVRARAARVRAHARPDGANAQNRPVANECTPSTWLVFALRRTVRYSSACPAESPRERFASGFVCGAIDSSLRTSREVAFNAGLRERSAGPLVFLP